MNIDIRLDEHYNHRYDNDDHKDKDKLKEKPKKFCDHDYVYKGTGEGYHVYKCTKCGDIDLI